MLTGWKEIRQFTKRSRFILLKLRKEQNFPLIYLEGVWTSDEELIRQWMSERIKSDAKNLLSSIKL